MVKPKVGLLIPGHRELDARMNKESSKREVLDELRKLSVDVIDVGYIAKSKSEILKVARTFRSEDVDCVLVYVADYFTEELMCLLVEELFDLPFFLLTNYGSDKAIVPVSSLLILASNSRRLNKRFFYHIGEPKEQATRDAILAFLMAAGVKKRLRRSSIGVIGHPNPGMLDTTYSEFHMRKIVPHILYLDNLELIDVYEKTKEKEARMIVEDLKTKVSKIEIKDETLVDAVRSYLAMKKLIEKYKLDGITIREWPEVGKFNFSMCLGTSLLMPPTKLSLFLQQPIHLLAALLFFHYLSSLLLIPFIVSEKIFSHLSSSFD